LLSLVIAVVMTLGFVCTRQERARDSAHAVDAAKQVEDDLRARAAREGIPFRLRLQSGKTPGTFTPQLVPGADVANPHATTWRLMSFGDLGSVQFYLGLDGLNVWLILLTAVLMVSAILISWTSIRDRVHEFHAWLLLLGTGMFGVFLAFDVVLF